VGKTNGKLAARTPAAIAFVSCMFLLCLLLATATQAKAAKDDSIAPADPTIPAALCQVVYPLDQTPEEGYRYMFLGNAFFINDQGYLITAAHLLTYFKHGGEPYILVGPREGPRRMVEAPIVAADWEHDVAVLRATPNPFKGSKKIGYLPLSAEMPNTGSGVLTASLRPEDAENAHTSKPPLEDFSSGKVIRYQLFREQGLGEKELVLYDGQVVAGQSGSPLVSAETHGVVGVVVGRWLHPAVIPAGTDSGHETISPGAALRIHYAIGLLEQTHVAWQMASSGDAEERATAALSAATAGPAVAAPRPKPGESATSAKSEGRAEQAEGFAPPVPLSVVTTRYPPQALFGGEVLLDARVDANGKLGDVRVVSGDPPFVEPVLEAVRTWTFVPARMDGRAVEARIGVVFQFPQSFLPHVVAKEHKHPQVESQTTSDRAALPTLTIEPEYPATTTAEGSVAFYAVVDSEGNLASASVLRDVEALTAPAMAAAQHWEFAASERDGAKTDSTLVVVVTFRRPPV
jgi:TonB family protein